VGANVEEKSGSWGGCCEERKEAPRYEEMSKERGRPLI